MSKMSKKSKMSKMDLRGEHREVCGERPHLHVSVAHQVPSQRAAARPVRVERRVQPACGDWQRGQARDEVVAHNERDANKVIDDPLAVPPAVRGIAIVNVVTAATFSTAATDATAAASASATATAAATSLPALAKRRCAACGGKRVRTKRMQQILTQGR